MRRLLAAALSCVAVGIGVAATPAFAVGPSDSRPAVESRAENTQTVAATAGTFVTTAGSRVLDTRLSMGAAAPGHGGTVKLQVDGVGQVPATGVSAVVLNVTVTAPTAAGFITAFADLAALPPVSNLNFSKAQTVANLVVVPVGSDGKVDLFNGSAGTTQLIGDIAGYYLAGTPVDAGAFVATAGSRVLDTRLSLGASAPGPGGTVKLQVDGVGQVPATGVSAVVLNVTVTAPTAAGFITAFADLAALPSVSGLNFSKAQTVANLVVVPVGSDGKVDLFNGSAGTTQLIGDIAGYYLAGTPVDAGAFVATAGSRVLDTRLSMGASAPGPGGTVKLQVDGVGQVPATGVSAVVMNVTVTAPTAGGFVTAFADLTAPPSVSGLNFSKAQTVANLVVVPVGSDGKVDLFNGSAGTTQLIGDIAGYYLASPPAPTMGAVSGLVVTGTTTNSVALSWTNPQEPGLILTGVMIRRAVGPVPPTSPTDGTLAGNTASTSTNSFLDYGLAAGTQYSYALFAYNIVPDYSVGVPITATTATMGAVSGLVVTGTTTNSVALSWTNPQEPGLILTGVMIRRAVGPVPPTSPTDGTLAGNTASTSTNSFLDYGLAAGPQYSYALFAYNIVPDYSVGVPITATTATMGAVS